MFFHFFYITLQPNLQYFCDFQVVFVTLDYIE